MLAAAVKWLVFIHVLGALTFYMAHGASAAMAFRIRKETDLARIRAMLDLSMSTLMVMGIAFLVMGLTGLILPFLIKIWDRVYIWLSIVLLVIVVVYMAAFNQGTFNELRRLVGLPYRRGNKNFPAEAPASREAVIAQLGKINVAALAIFGYVIPGFVLWMMVFKPF